jgi:bifunctional DNase/RNase
LWYNLRGFAWTRVLALIGFFGEEQTMIKVTIDSVRASLLSQHRVVVLKEEEMERYLAIWIGPYEADAITIKLQGVEIARPLTHDLLKQSIDRLGAKVSHVLVNDLHDDTFYARVVMDRDGERVELDSRPSDVRQ